MPSRNITRFEAQVPELDNIWVVVKIILGTLNIRGRIIVGIQKGTIILTTTHMPLKTGSFHSEPVQAPRTHFSVLAPYALEESPFTVLPSWFERAITQCKLSALATDVQMKNIFFEAGA